MNNQNLPSRSELESDLSRLREVSSNIDRLTKFMITGELPVDEVTKLIEQSVSEQSKIVDKFIALSQDWDSLRRFSEIVKNIEAKSEQLKSCEDPDEYQNIKIQVLEGIDEWISCLELIIMGVISRATK